MESKRYIGHGGRILASGRRGAFFLTETRYSAGEYLPMHAHERDCFSVVLAGAYQEEFGHLTLDAAQSALIFRPAGELHRDRVAAGGAHCLLLEPDRDWTRRLQACQALPRRPARARGDSVALGWRLYREFRFSDDLSPIVIEGLAMELAALMARGSRRPPQHEPRWLIHARDLLHSSFQKPLSLTAVALDAGVHPVSLARAFRHHYGCTVGEYIRRLRIRYACDRLLGSDDSLVEIAYAAGFSHQAHLSRTFKHTLGLSPGQFRRLRRSD